jgi:glutathione S-transferase
MLTIYGVPLSVHTRKVIVAALEKDLPYQVVPVVPVVPGNPPPNWREISPTGRIPAMTDDDFTVADSTAICAYLDRLRPAPPLYPADPRGYARALSLEAYAGESLFREVVRTLFHEAYVLPKVQGVAMNQAVVDEVLTKALPDVFGYLDGAVCGDYLLGDTPTIADFAVVSNLVTQQYIGFELPRGRFPRLAGLFDRVVRRPSMREALRREQGAVDAMGLRRDFLRAVLEAS